MTGTQFIPRMKHQAEAAVSKEQSTDEVIQKRPLLFLVRILVSVLLVGVPVFFVPGLWASLGFNKVLFVVTGVVVVLLLLSFMALRVQSVKTATPVTIAAFWLFVLIAYISGIASGDTQDALRGSAFEVHTVGFFAVLALAMSVPLVLQRAQSLVVRTLVSFSAVTALILLYNVVRIVSGTALMPFASFTAITTSPIGGFNDLAIFSGLAVVLALVTLVQLPLRLLWQLILVVTVLFALLILAVINFFNIWLLVGLAGLLTLFYTWSRDHLFVGNAPVRTVTNQLVVLVTAALVSVVSAVFVVFSGPAEQFVNTLIPVDYVEVTPSFGATVHIIESVYETSPWLGVGPNRFDDAWRLHKNPAVNQTIFWDTDFRSGSGYVPTLFSNVGLLGGGMFLLFQALFLIAGLRMLVRNTNDDPLWYYIGSVSFVGALFIWILSYLYVPGVSVLLIGAFFTGLTFVGASALVPKINRTISLMTSRNRGFFVMAIALVVAISSVGILLTVSQQYVAQTLYAKAEATAASPAEFEQIAQAAYTQYPDNRFILTQTQLKLSEINRLLTIQEPSQTDEEQFLSTIEQAQVLIERALARDITDPDNHAVLAGIYSSLAVAGVNGAQDRAVASLREAQQYDPLNPGYHLMIAQMARQLGDTDLARTEVEAALDLKSNYTAAYYFLAQLEIAAGNTSAASEVARSLITLEPRNPTRYYQYGMLLASAGSYEEAIAVFQTAIQLDRQYANARYMLAIAYLTTDQRDAALTQLRIVAETNPDNEQLLTLIERIETDALEVIPSIETSGLVDDLVPEENFENTVTTEGEVDSALITPVNTNVNESESEPEAAAASSDTSGLVEDEAADATESPVTE